MKKVVLCIAITALMLFSVETRTAQATPMLPNLDFWGSQVPNSCIICDMTVNGVGYEDGTSAPPLSDPIIGSTARIDYGTNTFSIFSGIDTFLTADIDWSKGSTQTIPPGLVTLINPEFSRNLYNVVLDTGLGSNYIGELYQEVTLNGGFAAMMLTVVDNGNGNSNIWGKVVPTPEPGTLLLLGSGLVGLGAMRKRRKKA